MRVRAVERDSDSEYINLELLLAQKLLVGPERILLTRPGKDLTNFRQFHAEKHIFYFKKGLPSAPLFFQLNHLS